MTRGPKGKGNSEMLGDQVLKLRTARRLSQRELGKALGVTKQCVSNWENSNIMPSIELVRQMAVFFGCTTDYILEAESPYKYYIDTSSLSNSQVTSLLNVVEEYRALNAKLPPSKDEEGLP